MKLDYFLQFDKLFGNLGLGTLISRPKQVFGGHLHRMYAVTATTGRYAVKALNPQVMLRPEAKQNIINAERIARVAARYIPALPAKWFDGDCMPKVGGQYYNIFDWVDGGTLSPGQILPSHCQRIGKILAQLHKIDFSYLEISDDGYADEKRVDWHYYLQKGKEAGSAWTALLGENIHHLCDWNNRLIESMGKLASEDIILSHGDLDPKNVMWRDGEPILIDWEAAGAIHAMHDFIITGLYWADEDVPDKDKFSAFLKGYREAGGVLNADWVVIFDKGFGSKLGWLEYSLKRSLGIECTDEAERKMGTEHVFGTMNRLHNYCNSSKWIIELLDGLK